jgi:hypothetical protein
VPNSLVNPEFRPGAPAGHSPRRWRFLALLVAAGLGWAIPAAILYLAFWRG